MFPSPIYLPGYREVDALFRVCQAKDCSPCSRPLEATIISLGHCSLSVTLCPLLFLSIVSASLKLCYIMLIFHPWCLTKYCVELLSPSFCIIQYVHNSIYLSLCIPIATFQKTLCCKVHVDLIACSCVRKLM